jgi:hypothetical protein
MAKRILRLAKDVPPEALPPTDIRDIFLLPLLIESAPALFSANSDVIHRAR